MSYEYLDGITVADVAFRAEGASVEELFREACDALTGSMVENLPGVEARVRRPVSLSSESLEMLLFELLQELIFFKDAERLLLRLERADVVRADRPCGPGVPERGVGGGTSPRAPECVWKLGAVLAGERIDPARHDLVVDVKAVTLHRFSVEETPGGWRATVVLDV